MFCANLCLTPQISHIFVQQRTQDLILFELLITAISNCYLLLRITKFSHLIFCLRESTNPINKAPFLVSAALNFAVKMNCINWALRNCIVTFQQRGALTRGHCDNQRTQLTLLTLPCIEKCDAKKGLIVDFFLEKISYIFVTIKSSFSCHYC